MWKMSVSAYGGLSAHTLYHIPAPKSNESWSYKKHVAGNSGRLSAFAVRRDFFLLYIILESSQCILIYNDEM